jgi:hypothetical protein
MTRPETGFNWSIYRDATLAGLAVLIPCPARRRLRAVLPPPHARLHCPRPRPPAAAASARLLNRWGCSPASLLLFPLWLLFWLLKRLSKKLLYFLTVKDAVDTLNYYWHRAFLLDYMLRAGHLDDVAQAERAEQALSRTLAEVRESPLTTVARQVVRQTAMSCAPSSPSFRRGQETDELRPAQRHGPDLEPIWRLSGNGCRPLPGNV